MYLYNSGVGWALLGTLWFLAFAGIVLTISAFDHLPKYLARVRTALAPHTDAPALPARYVPLTMFMTMGWMGAILAIAVYPFVGLLGISLVALGGVFYTARRAAA